jgi:uncharacterized protein YdhG (YjbR/CyaY superfamily)
MVMSKAATVAQYLAELPPERRKAISAVRKVIKANLPAGFKETMGYGMINYVIPLTRYPDTYNGQPLCYAALASQKNFCSVYLMGVYGDPRRAAWFKDGFKRAGKKLDAGKSCVHFNQADDLPLELIGEVIGGISVEAYIRNYEASRAR